MLNIEWKKLHTKYGAPYNGRFDFEIPEGKWDTKLTFNAGKNAGKIVTLTGFREDKARVRFQNGEEAWVRYGRLFSLNMYGEANDAGPRDMVGELFIEDAWVAYSRKTGKQGHAFCLGRVLEIGKGGTLRVKEVLRDGFLVPTDPNRRNEVNIKHIRALKLPVDPNRLTMAIFSNFATMDGSLD